MNAYNIKKVKNINQDFSWFRLSKKKSVLFNN